MALNRALALKHGDLGPLPNASGTVAISASGVQHGPESSYSIRCNPTTTGTGYFYLSGFSNSAPSLISEGAYHGVWAFAFRPDSIPSASEEFFYLYTANGTPVSCKLNSDGSVTVTAGGITQTSAAGVFTGGSWHWVCLGYDVTCTDESFGDESFTFHFYVNGSEITFGGTLTSGTTNFNGFYPYFGKRVNTNGASVDFYYDDIVYQDGGSSVTPYPLAEVKSVMRKFTSTTPTYNSFTKSNSSTIDTVWGDTPFSATTYAQSGTTTAQVAQTAHTASFQDVVNSGDTVLGFQAVISGKTSSASSGGGGGAIRRRLSSDSDATINFTVSDASYSTMVGYAPIACAYSDLAADGFEVGWYKSTTGNRNHTVEDAFAIVFYQPAGSSTTPLTLDTLTDQQTQSDDLLTDLEAPLTLSTLTDQQTQADDSLQNVGLTVSAGADQQTQSDTTAQGLSLGKVVGSDQQQQSDSVAQRLSLGAVVGSDQQVQSDGALNKTSNFALTLWNDQLTPDDTIATDLAVSLVPLSLSTLADQQTQADAALQQVGHRVAIADSQTESDTAAEQLGLNKAVSDSQTQTDTTTQFVSYSLTVGDALSQADAVSSTFDYLLKALADQDSYWTDNLNTQTNQPLLTLSITDSMSQADAYATFMSHALLVADQQPQTDAVAQVLLQMLTVADSLTQADTVVEVISLLQTLADAQAQTETLAIVNNCLQALADATSQADAYASQLALLKALTDAITQSDSAVQSLVHQLALADSTTQTDTYAALMAVLQTLDDTQPQSDTIYPVAPGIGSVGIAMRYRVY